MAVTKKWVNARKTYFCAKCSSVIESKNRYCSVTFFDYTGFPTTEKWCMKCCPENNLEKLQNEKAGK